MTTSLSIAMSGLGTVGCGVVNLWRNNYAKIRARTPVSLNFAAIGARRNRFHCALDNITHTTDIFAPVRDPTINMLIEAIGGVDVARELVLAALQSGKHVVTANKALLAEHGAEIFACAQAQQRNCLFEAAIAGGIPIVKVVREALAGNRINAIYGIVNGTSHYILATLGVEHADFNTALCDAQQRGYAEADPTFDITGADAVHKIALLGMLAFHTTIACKDIYCEGIEQVTAEDIRYAREWGFAIKPLAIARLEEGARLQIRVHPALLPLSMPLAQITGVTNAVCVDADPLGQSLYIGPGAGGDATASAIWSDVLDLARAYPHVLPGAFPQEQRCTIAAMDAIRSEFYVCLHVVDRPGVMARISRHLYEHRISIKELLQKPAANQQPDAVPVVIHTHGVCEADLRAALKALQQTPEVLDQRIRTIRVFA